MKKLFLLAALFAAAAFSSCSKHDGVETPVPPDPVVEPEPQPLAITFDEGNSLEFSVDETKTVHYTITGGSDNAVVKAEMQESDDAYIVETTPNSATEGTIAIAAKIPTDNRVIVSVSDDLQTVTAEIVVILKAFDGKTAVVETPGTLSQLLADYDKSAITELTFIGNLNNEDIAVLKNFPNLAILDMENANLEVLPAEAFKDKTSLISVKLPKTLKTIEKSAFEGCSSLTNITIPDSVTGIGSGAFYGCTSLTSITIPDSVTGMIGSGAFYGCTSLTSITIPNGVTSIWAEAFSNCTGLKSVTIPDSVTVIGNGAFYGCSSLTNITIPDNVTSIGDSVFYACSGLIAFYGKFTSADNRCLIIDGKLIAFAPAGLTSYTIPDSVTTIGANAFRSYSNLTNITIPNSVTSIGWAVFDGCSGLTSITIPDSVTSIDGTAFGNCRSLTAIYCKAIVPPVIDTYAFNKVSATLSVPTGCKAAYAAADGWKNFTTIIETSF